MRLRGQNPRAGAGGFTLLECVVALAILGLSLMAIFDLNAGAVASHAYTKRLTVATLLARSKMTDLEQQLYDEGFSTDDQEVDGDFSEEGWASFKWKAKILAPRTEDVSPDQLLSALFGLPAGQGGGLDALFGGALGGTGAGAKIGDQKKTGDQESAAPENPTQAGAGLGPLAGMAQAQMQQLVSQIGQSVREVHLTVSWPDGKDTDTLDLVEDVVSTGAGSDRNGAGTQAVPGQVPGQMVPGQVPGQTTAPGNPSTPPFGGVR